MKRPGNANPLSAALHRKFATTQLLCLDVDGVLTDGKLYYGSNGEELKAFFTQDGSALKRLMQSGLQVAIISGRRSAMVARRAQELGITHVYEGYADKIPALTKLEAASGISSQHMAHAGDDVADLGLFERVGLALAVADAHPDVRARADYVSTLPGGRGAVREIAELIMAARQQ